MAFAPGRPVAAAEQFSRVDSLPALRAHLARDGARIRLAPGTYRLDQADSPNFLEFTGHDSHYDFTGVTLEVDTALFRRFGKTGINMILLTGNRIVFEGLSLLTVGDRPPPRGARALSIAGDGVVVRHVSLRLSGSHPYGYGSFFGISGASGATIDPQKMNGIRIGGRGVQVVDCRVIMRCFGHGIFLRGAQNALVKGCQVEGSLRRTDDILAEKSGPAFDLGFQQYTGQPIPPGRMTSLSEDGIRAYPDDPDNGRRTQDIRVENCRVSRMRRGICLAFAAGTNSVIDCEVTESERVGFHLGSHTTVRTCRGDALYTQVLDLSSSASRRADVELAVLDSRRHYGNDLLVKINGADHRVVLTEAHPGAVPPALVVEVASLRGFSEGRRTAASATRLTLANRTPARVVLHDTATSSQIESIGPVENRGPGNSVRAIAPQFQRSPRPLAP